MKKNLICLLFAIVSLSLTANARILFYHVKGTCPDGQTRTEMGIVDDATGLFYLVVRDCGTTCFYPLYGPFRPVIKTDSHWWTPLAEEIWNGNVDIARKNTTPGVYVGLWLLTETNDTVKFRNVVDDNERQQYAAIWESEQGDGEYMLSSDDREGSLKVSDRELSDLLVASMMEDFRAGQQNATADRQASRALVDKYWSYHFASRFPNQDELQQVADISAKLVRTGQVLSVRQTPAPSNAQTLIIAPIDPAFAGPVAVRDVNGKPVWEGNVDGSTQIPLLNYPTGTYFVQGTEGSKPLVINIVH